MPIIYKEDILQKLKDKGYNTTRIRKEGILSESVLTYIRQDKYISLQNLERLCELLECQPADLIEYVPNTKESEQEQAEE